MGKVVSAPAGATVGGIPVGEAIKAGDLVGFSGGQMVRAIGAAGGVVVAVGIAAASYRAGDTGAMHLMGEISGFSALAIGDAQYLSLVDAGEIQSDLPAGAGNYRQLVGYAVAADRVAMTIPDHGAQL